MLLMLPV